MINPDGLFELLERSLLEDIIRPVQSNTIFKVEKLIRIINNIIKTRDKLIKRRLIPLFEIDGEGPVFRYFDYAPLNSKVLRKVIEELNSIGTMGMYVI
jgi:hypothetical protein